MKTPVGMMTLVERQAATQATLAQFRGQAFNWKAGVTCVHLARFHLQRCGHRPPALPGIGSALAAKRALAKRGWASCAAMLDAQPGLTRIAPAMMLMGDLATLPGDDGIDAIVICAGPQKVFGWREDAAGLVVLDIDYSQVSGAWRV